MRHRIGIAASTGLGNPSPELINGRGTGDIMRDELIRQCSKDAYETFFKGTKLDYEGVDAGVHDFEVRIGVEPAYMYESLKMIVLHENINSCRFITGYAWEPYGSGIRKNVRWYRDLRRKGKFARFVDRWQPILFPGPVPA